MFGTTLSGMRTEDMRTCSIVVKEEKKEKKEKKQECLLEYNSGKRRKERKEGKETRVSFGI